MTASFSSKYPRSRRIPLLVAIAAAAMQPAAAGGPRIDIPLCDGLTIVTAIEDPRGDYESIKRITSVTASTVQVVVNGDKPTPKGVRKISVTRTIRQQDLRDAR